MMYKRILVGVVAVSLALGCDGCNDDAAGRACEQITPDPSLPQALCNNSADKCFLLDHAAEIRQLSGTCATQTCVRYVANPTIPEAIKCFTDCLDAALKAKFNGASVSAACLQCPDAVVTCSTSMDPAGTGGTACVVQCLSSPDSEACTNCLCAQHPNGLGTGKPGSCLIDAYAQCTGFRPTTEEAMCPAGSL